MKDLSDFIAMGKEVGLPADKLLSFAESKYESYLKTLEIEKQEKEKERQAEEAKFERELRLLERKAKIADAEKAAAESSGSGGSRASPHVPAFKFTPFNERSDDLDTWFTLFEKQCDAYRVKDNDRKAHLLSLFSGQCRQAFLSSDATAT